MQVGQIKFWTYKDSSTLQFYAETSSKTTFMDWSVVAAFNLVFFWVQNMYVRFCEVYVYAKFGSILNE